jgi:hypothetical protein
METDTFYYIYMIVWSILAMGVGIAGIFFRKWVIDFNARGFLRWYKITNFSLFKWQAEKMRKPYMNILTLFVSIMFFVLGILILINTIGVYIAPSL